MHDDDIQGVPVDHFGTKIYVATHDTVSAHRSFDGIVLRSWSSFDVVGSPRTVCPSSKTLPAMMSFNSSFLGATYPSPVALSKSARSPLRLLSTSWSRCCGWTSTARRSPRTFLGTHLFHECLLEIHHLRIVSKCTRSHVFASCCVAEAHVHPNNVDVTTHRQLRFGPSLPPVPGQPSNRTRTQSGFVGQSTGNTTHVSGLHVALSRCSTRKRGTRHGPST